MFESFGTFKRLCILCVSLVLSGVVLYVGRMVSNDDTLIAVIYCGIMAVAFVVYMLDVIKDFKNETYDYEGEMGGYENRWENAG